MPVNDAPALVKSSTGNRARLEEFPRIQGPSKAGSCCQLVYEVTGRADADVRWCFKDGQSKQPLPHPPHTGRKITVEWIPTEWQTGELVAEAHLGRPPITVSHNTTLDATEVGTFIALVRKVEHVHDDWGFERVLNSLRRNAGYDDDKWQFMLGRSAPADDLGPEGVLTQADCDALARMSKHTDDTPLGAPEPGVALDRHGQKVALGHCLTGIAAGKYREPKVNWRVYYKNKTGLPTTATWLTDTMDNLYATTVAGDLGTLAWKIYSGEFDRDNCRFGDYGTTASHAELLGDIDGFLIGKNLHAFEGPSPLRLSEVLERYYCDQVAGGGPGGVASAHRCARFAGELDNGNRVTEVLLDQTGRFACTWAYKMLGRVRGAFVWPEHGPAERAHSLFMQWLDERVRAES